MTLRVLALVALLTSSGCIVFVSGRRPPVENLARLTARESTRAEIESVLGDHEAVRECVATVREDRPGDARLAAYFVPEKGKAVTVTDLRGPEALAGAPTGPDAG